MLLLSLHSYMNYNLLSGHAANETVNILAVQRDKVSVDLSVHRDFLRKTATEMIDDRSKQVRPSL